MPHVAFSQGTIGPPSDPRPPSLPSVPRNNDAIIQQDLNRKKDARETEEAKTNPQPTPQTVEQKVQEEKLVEAVIRETPFRLLLGGHFIAGAVSASTGRKKYGLDPGGEFDVSWRIFGNKPQNEWQPWVGFKSTMLSGSGVQDDRPGNYSMNYYGPTISYGWFELAPRSAGSQNAQGNASLLAARSGFLSSGGISLVSKNGRVSGGGAGKGDFERKGLAFDSPGLWVRATYYRIYYNAFGYSVSGGVQLGQGKRFVYVGLGAFGIY